MTLPAQDEISRFGKILLNWSSKNPRPMPWKSFSDPYRIWIAEIILQQTRVEQGTPYFERFIHHFPDLQSLAEASVEEVLVVWEGLGYYSRARNLHETARYVFLELDGRFPDNAADLQKLKGIGPYTAAAIASFAFDESIGVVDGNVKRVVSRYFNIDEAVNSTAMHKYIQTLVNEAVNHYPSAAFNQAIMNFGALNCVPRQPDCQKCPANMDCKAYLLDKVEQLPVKSGSQSKKKRWIYFGVYVEDGQIAMMQNHGSNIWKNLYMFPVIGENYDFSSYEKSKIKRKVPDIPLLDEIEWILSHRRMKIHFYHLRKRPIDWEQKEGIIMVESKNLENFAVPRPLRLFLNKISCKLDLNINDDQ